MIKNTVINTVNELINALQQQHYAIRDLRIKIRPVVIIAVLIGAFFLGRRASLELIILIIGTISALTFMREPLLAIFPLVLGAFVVHFEIGTGTQSAINLPMILIALLLGLWFMDMLVQQRRFYLYPSRVIPPAIALSVIAIISFIAGQLPWFTFATQVSLIAQIGGVSLFLLSTGAFLWISQRVTELKWLRWLVWLFISIGGVYVIGSWLVGNKIGLLIRPEATGSMFWTWLMTMAASQVFFNKQLKPRDRFLLGFVVLITALVGWKNRGWASGWVPALTALLVIVFLYNWRIGLVVSLFLGTTFVILNTGFTREFYNQDQYSLFTRQEAWRILMKEIVRVSPILGLGPANYYNYTPLFPILGYSVRFNSHNQYIDLIAQTGFLGLAIYLWFAAEVGWLGWRLKDRAAPGFEQAYVIGVLGGLAGTLVSGLLGDWVIPFVYNIGMTGFRASMFAWLFFGGLLVIERLVNQRAS